MIHTITTYKELHDWCKVFVRDESFGLFFLVGNPGHAKSYTLRKLVNEQIESVRKKNAALAAKRVKPVNTAIMPVTGQPRPIDHKPFPIWIEGGSVSAFKLFQEIYTHLDEMVILDDVDQVYTDRPVVRLLKSVCQTERVKEISWTTQNRQLADAGIPSTYKCRNRVAIIANHWEKLNEHVGSLNSRGIMLDFKPSIEEVFKYVKDNSIIKDKDILDFVGKNLWLAQSIDIRAFMTSAKIKKSGLPWQDALANSLGIREMLFIHDMNKDKSLSTEEQKATKFKIEFKVSRPKFFDYKKKLEEIIKERDIVSGKVTKRKSWTA